MRFENQNISEIGEDIGNYYFYNWTRNCSKESPIPIKSNNIVQNHIKKIQKGKWLLPSLVPKIIRRFS